MNVQSSSCPHAGFTLIESMLTLAILSLSLLALAGLQVTALQGNARAQRMTTAASIAAHTIEQFNHTPYTTIAAEAATQVTASDLDFTRRVTVTDGPLPNTKSVSVLVSWQEQSMTHTVLMATIIGP